MNQRNIRFIREDYLIRSYLYFSGSKSIHKNPLLVFFLQVKAVFLLLFIPQISYSLISIAIHIMWCYQHVSSVFGSQSKT